MANPGTALGHEADCEGPIVGLLRQGRAPNIVALLFFAKTLLLAFVLIPFGVGPDERHHFSYAYDLASGDVAPILGTGVSVRPPLADTWPAEVQRNRLNYIAQHPPLHYAMSAIPIRAALWLTDDSATILRSPRLISAIFGVLGLLAVHRIVRFVSGRADIALAVMAGLAFLPMHSYLSAVVNNDVSLLFFSALSAEAFLRFIATRRNCYLRTLVLWTAVASLTKAFAWISGAIVALVVIALILRAGKRLSTAIYFAAAMAAGPAVWIIRNAITRGEALAGSGLGASPGLPQVTVWQFVTEYPVVDQLILHSNILYGWVRPGLEIRVTTVNGWPLILFSVALLFLGAISIQFSLLSLADWLERYSRNRWNDSASIGAVAALILGGLTAAFVLVSLPVGLERAEWMRVFFVAALVFAAVVALAELAVKGLDRNGEGLALLVFMAFVSVYLFQRTLGLSAGDAMPRAIHGRYFWAVLPFLLSFFGAAAARIPVNRFFLSLGVLLLAVLDLAAYLTQLLPHEGVA